MEKWKSPCPYVHYTYSNGVIPHGTCEPWVALCPPGRKRAHPRACPRMAPLWQTSITFDGKVFNSALTWPQPWWSQHHRQRVVLYVFDASICVCLSIARHSPGWLNYNNIPNNTRPTSICTMSHHTWSQYLSPQKEEPTKHLFEPVLHNLLQAMEHDMDTDICASIEIFYFSE